jgi:hypothetical protein
VAFHAFFFLGVEAVNLQIVSIQDRSIPQTYLPLFVPFYSTFTEILAHIFLLVGYAQGRLHRS